MAIATINPTTGETEQTFEPHDAQEIERRIALADAATRAMRTTTFAERAAWMNAAADVLESEADEIARIMTVEMGKPLAQAKAEALKCVKGMRFYAEHAEGFLAEEKLADAASVNASSAYTRYEPLGAVLAVMPWNYPLWQVVRFAAPALMAGNSGLLKHASNVPQSALYLDTLFERGGFPAGAFATLLIGSKAVEAVLHDKRVKAVTLTGSEPAGREVAATAAGQIKKAVLELGGSDPFIVMPSADLEKAVATAVTARVQNNGQSCIAGKRFIVHADIYDQFAALFAEKLSALVVGDPMDAATQVGPTGHGGRPGRTRGAGRRRGRARCNGSHRRTRSGSPRLVLRAHPDRRPARGDAARARRGVRPRGLALSRGIARRSRRDREPDHLRSQLGRLDHQR